MIDVLICASLKDAEGLFPFALGLLLRNCSFIGNVHVVTPNVDFLRNKIPAAILNNVIHKVFLYSDIDIIGQVGMALPGWFRQQYIKLMADRLCGTDYIICLGADTLVLKWITYQELFSEDGPKIYFFRYSYPNSHLAFERTRVINIASILKTTPNRSFIPGDFISDFFLMDRKVLISLRNYLDILYGSPGLLKVLTNHMSNEPKGNYFGEQTLYAVYTLDVLEGRSRIFMAPENWFRQVHSWRDMLRPNKFDAKIIHFVCDISDQIKEKLIDISAIITGDNFDTLG